MLKIAFFGKLWLALGVKLQLNFLKISPFQISQIALRVIGRAPIEYLIHPFIMRPIDLILFPQGNLKPFLNFKHRAEQRIHLFVKFFVSLGSKQADDVFTNLFAQFGGGLIVLFLPLLELLEQNGGIKTSIEALFKTEGLVELVDEFVVILRAEDLAYFVSRIVVRECEHDVLNLLGRGLFVGQLQHLFQLLLPAFEDLHVLLNFSLIQLCNFLLQKLQILLINVLSRKQKLQERFAILFSLHGQTIALSLFLFS